MARTTRRLFVQQSTFAAAAFYTQPVAALLSERQPLDSAAVRKLTASIRGRVITPESVEYDSSRVVFNRAFDRRPALIVRCSGATDVARALEFTRRQRLPLAIRGGGHSRAGFGVCEGGVVIDLSSLNHVEVDAAKRTARADAGCLVRDLDGATQKVGLATTMGGCPTVGIAGLTLGGGEGLLMSKYGAACDNLLSAKLVTVDGRQIEASPSLNPDLFWAIRGGGGNFGVVTSLEYRLYPVTEVLAGTLTYPPNRIPELLDAFARFAAAAPDEMNVVGVVLPSEQGARFHVIVCHCGDPAQGMSLLKPLRALEPEEDKIRVASYLETQATINPYAPVAHFQTNLFLPKLTSSAIAILNTATEHAPPNTSVHGPAVRRSEPRRAERHCFRPAAAGLRVGPPGPLEERRGTSHRRGMGQVTPRQIAALRSGRVLQPTGRNERGPGQGVVRSELPATRGDQEAIRSTQLAADQSEHSAQLGANRAPRPAGLGRLNRTQSLDRSSVE